MFNDQTSKGANDPGQLLPDVDWTPARTSGWTITHNADDITIRQGGHCIVIPAADLPKLLASFYRFAG